MVGRCAKLHAQPRKGRCFCTLRLERGQTTRTTANDFYHSQSILRTSDCAPKSSSQGRSFARKWFGTWLAVAPTARHAYQAQAPRPSCTRDPIKKQSASRYGVPQSIHFNGSSLLNVLTAMGIKMEGIPSTRSCVKPSLFLACRLASIVHKVKNQLQEKVAQRKRNLNPFGASYHRGTRLRAISDLEKYVSPPGKHFDYSNR